MTAHECLHFRFHEGNDLWNPGANVWQFARSGEVRDVAVSGRIVSNDADALIAAAVAGRGIVMMPDWLVAGEIERGALTALLTEFDAGPAEPEKCLHLVYPVNRRGSPKVRVFVDYLAGCFADFNRARCA